MAARRADVLAKGLPYLVAEEGGQVLGFAYCQWFKPRPAYRFSAEDSIYLHPDAAGQGLGKQLLAEPWPSRPRRRRAQADRRDRRLGQRRLHRRAPGAGLHAGGHHRSPAAGSSAAGWTSC
jgi:GNAT superfamily N-acetyltransferase